MAITKASAQTTVNSGVNAASAATVNQITVAPVTATVVAGGGTLGGVTISNIAITDSTFANVLSGDTAVGSSGGFVRVTGTGFKTGAGVFFNNARVANTFVSSTQINANIPATSAGTYSFYIFNADGSGSDFAAGVTTSGFPTITTTTYTIEQTSNTQIVASGDSPFTFSIQPGSSNLGNFTVNSAGYIGATAVPEGYYTLTVIVDDAQGQSTQATLTVEVILSDPYFNVTTLLLSGDGTNNANNQAFLDSSSNNFTVTRNGNATQGTFSPFSQTGWSNYFDGVGDYLEVADNAALDFSTGDFTVEAWIYPTESQATNAGVVAKGGSTTGYTLNVTGTTLLVITESATLITSLSGLIQLNSWNHIAFVRSSGTSSLYHNGLLVGSAADAQDYNNTPVQRIGINRTAGSEFKGYISNVRIVKGTALYTGSTYTVPTQPLTAVSGTSLLTCQSNRFVDNSVNAFAITLTGTPSVQAFSPFAPTAEYSAAAVGGSAYFDGTGDYLSVANNASLQLGTSPFTIQAWIYRSVSGVAHPIIAKGRDPAVSTGFVFQVAATNVLRFTHGATNVDGGTIPSGTWVHVAAVRTGTGTNGFQLFVNGVGVATATVATNFNQTNPVFIGGDREPTTLMNGYISGLKFTNGTAETITVPTAPPTPTANVALLCNFTNAGITDATGKNVFETVNQAKISTAQSKFGGSSMYFDGVDDYLTAPYAPWSSFGTGPFTIECWVNFDVLSGNRLLIETYTSAATGGGWQLYWRGTGTSITWYANGVVVAQSTFTSHTTGTWYHVAVTRDTLNFLRIFVDGTQYANVSYATAINSATTSNVNVGIQKTTLTNDFAGYLDEVRVTVGYARYTANFTPPDSAFKLR